MEVPNRKPAFQYINFPQLSVSDFLLKTPTLPASLPQEQEAYKLTNHERTKGLLLVS